MPRFFRERDTIPDIDVGKRAENLSSWTCRYVKGLGNRIYGLNQTYGLNAEENLICFRIYVDTRLSLNPMCFFVLNPCNSDPNQNFWTEIDT